MAQVIRPLLKACLYQNYFDMKSPLKNSGNSWGERGSSKTPLERKILGGRGGANQSVFRGRGMDIFWNHTIQLHQDRAVRSELLKD